MSDNKFGNETDSKFSNDRILEIMVTMFVLFTMVFMYVKMLYL